MESEKKRVQLLDFINNASVLQLDNFADTDKNGIGETLSKRIKETQAKLFDSKFTSLEQISSIKGLGDDKMNAMFLAIEGMEKNKLIKSRTIFTFIGSPPVIESLSKQIQFVLIKNKNTESEEKQSYHLYYDKNLDKNHVFKNIRSAANFINSHWDQWFAIQGTDGQFLSANPITHAVSFVPHLGTNGYEYFKIDIGLNNHRSYDPNTGSNQDVQKYSFLYSLFKCKADPIQDYQSPYSTLYLDYADRIVKYGIPATNAHFPQHFDIFGIIGQPAWANGTNPFKSFTLLTYFDNAVLNPDQRVFLSQGQGQLKGLIGNNIGWSPKNWFRYVDILDSISIKAVWEVSGYTNMHLSVNQNNAVSFIHVHTWQAQPLSTQFDLISFYGYWDERQTIATKVCIRSKANGKFLSVDANTNVTCNSVTMGQNETFLVEDGWGGNPNNIVLKTNFGKYFYHYISYAKADTVAPVTFEQMEIIIP
jgi:hypothetical protein